VTETGWKDILDDDEDIIWQGRPDGKVVIGIKNIAGVIFGIFFAGFALFWMTMAASAGGYFWAFGLIHFAVGLGIMAGAVFWKPYVRRNSWYTLTSRRAFIASKLPLVGKSLKSYPIGASTPLDFRQGDPSTIIFATERKRTNNGTRKIEIGFERIEDGHDVYKKFREVQKNR